MKVKAQIAMILNLDKCIGCHTCSVTCKNTWTNRPGAEYMWFNNVETKPGVGYPKRWEDQEHYKGGWLLNKKGKLELKSGSPLKKTFTGQIFGNPNMPSLDDYYEPWTYHYDKLFTPKEHTQQPVARPQSLISGKHMEIEWGPNWEDDLAGAPETVPLDPNIKKIQEEIKVDFENTFMAYLPRLCEHCLNPSCVASCPSGAIYKRDEDGIVLVNQESCRSWRFCMSGCPYKKVYFNWKTSKAEKCTFCFPRIESGLPTVCSETCTGRIRYLGVLLYDADRVESAASVTDDEDLYQAQLAVFLDPNDPVVIEQARKDGIHEEWMIAAQNSPVYKLAIEYKVAFPLHPEFRTMPMVWYIPPLSPIMTHFEGKDSIQNPDLIFPTIQEMRIPVSYLSSILTAGNKEAIVMALQRLAMMRLYMRSVSVGSNDFDKTRLENVAMTGETAQDMYRLLAIAKYEERNVIPTSHKEDSFDAYNEQGQTGYHACNGCSLSETGNGMNRHPQTKQSNQASYEKNVEGVNWRD